MPIAQKAGKLKKKSIVPKVAMRTETRTLEDERLRYDSDEPSMGDFENEYENEDNDEDEGW